MNFVVFLECNNNNAAASLSFTTWKNYDSTFIFHLGRVISSTKWVSDRTHFLPFLRSSIFLFENISKKEFFGCARTRDSELLLALTSSPQKIVFLPASSGSSQGLERTLSYLLPASRSFTSRSLSSQYIVFVLQKFLVRLDLKVVICIASMM